MGKPAALLVTVLLGLANLALAVAGFIISRQRFPDVVEPLHVQFILLGCGLILVGTIVMAQRMHRSGYAPPGWLYALSEAPAILAFALLGWRGLFVPSLMPLICTALVQFAVLLPGAAKLGR